MKRSFLRLAAALLLLLALTACGGKGAVKDNPRNADGIGETEILLVSYGTADADARVRSIGALEAAAEQAFPDKSVRRAFVSESAIRAAAAEGVAVDSVDEALARAAKNGVKTLIVQPTLLLSGETFGAVYGALAQHAGDFDVVCLGTALLTTEEDVHAAAEALAEDTKDYDDGSTAICFVGHGTGAEVNYIYGMLGQFLQDAGHKNCFVGTMTAEPGLEDVLAQVRAGGYTRVLLQPLTLTAGESARIALSDSGEGSWKAAFEAEGVRVECRLRGLGELEAVRALAVQHVRDALDWAENNA